MSEDDRQLVTGTDILPISEVSKGRTLYKVHNYSPKQSPFSILTILFC